MSGLLESVEASIRKHHLLGRDESCLVAVSGGLDSMALLHLLHRLVPKYGWKLSVAHFNHRLRGGSSDADERLVRRTAAALGLPITCESARVNLKKAARDSGESIEMTARRERHQFFIRAAKQQKVRKIALAHHADDQVELFLLRLLRGSSGEGLAGMRWKGPSPYDPGLCLVRPLLAQTKRELQEFVSSARIRYREDASNASLSIQRNRVRGQLLPLLREFQPGLERTLLRTAELVGAEAACVAQLAREWLDQPARSPRSAFEQLPVAVQRRVIQLQIHGLGVVPDFDLIEKLRTQPDTPVCSGAVLGKEMTSDAQGDQCLEPAGELGIPEMRRVVRDHAGRVLTIRNAASADSFNEESKAVQLTAPQQLTTFSGIKVAWRFSPRRSGWKRKMAGSEVFDADRVGQQIILRHWRPGDRFQPIGMEKPVKLQNFFTNEKVDRSLRRKLVIAQTAEGEVFWVEGLRIAERFKVTEKTIRYLNWRWERF